MKRPRWLGGRATQDAEPARAKGRRQPAPAPNSSKARRRLADRVGKSGGAAPDAAPKRTERKPAAASEPKPELKRKDKGKGERAEEPLGKRRSAGEGTKGTKPLNRPRRQAGESGAAARRRRKRSSRRGSPSSRRRPRAVAGSFATALKRGGAATRRSVAASAPKLRRVLLAALGTVFALFFEVVGFVLSLLIAALRIVAVPVRAVSGALGRAARAASRLLTPARALAVVVAGAAILLALSQYADYRSVSIGNDAYSGVQTIAPAPETGRLQTGDAHSYVFVPVAIACLLLLGTAVIAGRWRLLRLVTLAGVAAIVVALLVDRPAGLDPGDAAVSFEGVRATLIGGFYAQIAAGIVLIASSALLARELRFAGARRSADDPGRERASRRTLPRRTGATGSARA